jgi:hypothetical protein
MGIAASLGAHWVATVLPGRSSAIRAVRLAIAMALGVAVLIGFARILRIAEFDEAFSRVLRRLRPAA